MQERNTQELDTNELEQVNGGFGPLVYFAAVAVGAAIGAAYSAYQGYKEARCKQTGQMCN